jgi:hypothetical protein
MKQLSFKSFFDASPIFEDMAAAKNYLVKRVVELENEKIREEGKGKEINIEKLKAADKEKICSMPLFLEIRKLLTDKKSLGYMLPFTKFAFSQGASIESLTELIDDILSKKQIISKLPKTVSEYSNLVKENPSDKPGYELLTDDLAVIGTQAKEKASGSRLMGELSRNFKNTILSQATPDQLAKIESFGPKMDALRPKKRVNKDTGKEEDYTIWDDFGKKTGKYENNGGYYPHYNDKKLALRDFIANTEDDIENWSRGIDGLVSSLRSFGTQCNIMYYRKGYLAVSIRTQDAQKELQKSISDWCIGNYNTHWESYVDKENNVQINILNSNVSPNSPFYLIGFTVRKNMTIRDSFDRHNTAMNGASGKNFITYLRDVIPNVSQPADRFSSTMVESPGPYPSDMIDKIASGFEVEANVKEALKTYFSGSKGLQPSSIIRSLLSFNKGFLSGTMSPEEWGEISSIVADIIAQNEHFGPIEFIKEFEKTGVISKAAWNIYDEIVGGSATQEQKDEIKKASEKALAEAIEGSELYKSFGIWDNPSEKDRKQIDLLKSVIVDLDYTKGRIANF